MTQNVHNYAGVTFGLQRAHLKRRRYINRLIMSATKSDLNKPENNIIKDRKKMAMAPNGSSAQLSKMIVLLLWKKVL